MEPYEYERMYQQEDHHWWFQSRLLMTEGLLRNGILPQLPERPAMLDLGCGTGLFLERRRERFETYGADFSAQALAFSRQRGLKRLSRADATALPFADHSFDLVTAFDLIEHVADDRALVQEVHRVLRPGGMLLATVPAHPMLWSGHDVSLHHHRRYQRAEFRALFEPTCWEQRRQTSCFTMVFPVAAAVRLGRRLLGSTRAEADSIPLPGPINNLLIFLHRFEAAWLARFNLPIGVSLLTIQRKK